MQARVMRITASMGFWMAASGTFSMRTSWALCMTVARISGLSFQIFFVCDLLHPGDRRAVQGFLDRDVGHGRGRRRAVPMLHVGRAPDDIAGTDFDDRLAFTLRPADTGGDDQGLAERVRVPCRARARFEGHNGPADTRRLLPLEQRVDPHTAGEPFLRSFEGRLCA